MFLSSLPSLSSSPALSNECSDSPEWKVSYMNCKFLPGWWTVESETLPSDRKTGKGQTSLSKPDDDSKGNSHAPPNGKLHMLNGNGRGDVYSSVNHFIRLNSLWLLKTWAHHFPLGCFLIHKAIFLVIICSQHTKLNVRWIHLYYLFLINSSAYKTFKL
jgi:hypothetical protein